jgi:hypothetical protein
MTKKTSKISPQTVRIFLLTPVVLLLLFAAYLSFRWALADVLSIQVRYQLGKAQTVGQSLDAKQWRVTHNLLEKTLWLHPDYSGYLELAEFFYQTASDQPAALMNELGWHDNRENALNFNRRALLARPSWPYFWDELIKNKVNLKQFDSELTGAMKRAINLGPWEESVQYDVAFTGLDQWDSLDMVAQQWAILALDKTLIMQSDPKPLVKQMLAQANIGKLCRSITEMPKNDLKILPKYCK